MSAKIVLAMMLALMLVSCASSETPAALEGTPAESARAQAWTPPEGGWASVSACYRHTAAIKADGSLWIWGDNLFGRLGDGTWTERHRPVRIGGGYDWAMVSVGGSNTAAIKTDGSLWIWGSGDTGQIGDGAWTHRTTPTQVGTDMDWAYVSITGGGRHEGRVAALKTDGSLWAWGENRVGAVGDGTTTNRNTPVRIGDSHDWARVSAGWVHTIALKTDGSLWAWGSNGLGRLGVGELPDRAVVGNRVTAPMRVGGDYDWVYISASENNSAAIRADGTLWIWGDNSTLQLGDGTRANRNTPGQVGASADWVSVSAGVWGASAIKSDGSLWAWGNNRYGRLGDGTTTHRPTPARAGERHDWVAVSSGRDHAMGITRDGSLWAWGRNNYGQLGYGSGGGGFADETHYSSPIRVAAP